MWDALSLRFVVTLAASAAALIVAGTDARAAAVTYVVDNPAVLVPADSAGPSIEVSPDQGLYEADRLPKVTVRFPSRTGARVSYRVLDGFGRVLTQASAPSNETAALTVELPPDRGYYEVVATLTEGGKTIAEVRRSIGALEPPAPIRGDEPFGLWIQGDALYPALGVRWTRQGIDWGSFDAKGRKYLDGRATLFEKFHRQGIRIIAYPKRLPRQFQLSREVIEDTPEAWRSLEQWWTDMVRTLGPHVDAWGVANEPMSDAWKGSNDLIVRYWLLMRRIVDRYDPGKPLLGPSLSPNRKIYVDQYDDLLRRGFGKSIDAIEMHTYIDDPQQGWADNTRQVAEMTRAATGRKLAVWSTEHGSSADYKGELKQAQHLARSWLEAKKIGYPVMIWHMFSYPQGTDRREVQFGIFRNTKDNSASPQPRPAGVAYGVATRQLAGTIFRGELNLGPGVHAYVFTRGDGTMVAVWTTGAARAVTIPAGSQHSTVTDLFGATETVQPKAGALRVTVDASPKFIANLPASLARESAGR